MNVRHAGASLRTCMHACERFYQYMAHSLQNRWCRPSARGQAEPDMQDGATSSRRLCPYGADHSQRRERSPRGPPRGQNPQRDVLDIRGATLCTADVLMRMPTWDSDELRCVVHYGTELLAMRAVGTRPCGSTKHAEWNARYWSDRARFLRCRS